MSGYIPTFSEVKHVQRRIACYLGDSQVVKKKFHVINPRGKIELTEEEASDALFTFQEEILQNAIDEYARGNCNEIKVSVDSDKIALTVINNSGINLTKAEVTKDGEPTGEFYYRPVKYFGSFRCSENYDEKVENKGGGTNGIGASAVNAVSSKFTCISCDGTKAGRFIWNDCILDEQGIRIKDSKKRPFVSVRAVANMDFFSVPKSGLKKLCETLQRYVKMRCYQIAVLTKGKCTMYFNGQRINVDSLSDIVPPKTKIFTMKNGWEVAIGKLETISVINGIYNIEGGSHITKIKATVTKKLNEKIEKCVTKKNEHSREDVVKFLKKNLKEMLGVVVFGFMVNPKFDGPTKKKIKNKYEDYGIMDIPDNVLDDIWKSINKDLKKSIALYTMKQVQQTARKTFPKGWYKSEKRYTPAHNLKEKGSRNNKIVFVEGESALTFAKAVYRSKETPVKDRNVSYVSLMGVPMNALKNVVPGTLTPNERVRLSLSLVLVKDTLGLEWGKPVERRKLRYDEIIIATDQDYDGQGHIRPLFLLFILINWPELIEWGMVKFLLSPYIIARKKDEFKYFYGMGVFEEWREKVGDKEFRKWKMKHCKGLGAHNKTSIKRMYGGNKYYESLIQYVKTDKCMEMAINMFGKSSAWRKDHIRITQPELIEDEYKRVVDRSISCYDHMDTAVLAFKALGNARKIPSAIDGLIASARKILFVALKRWRHKKATQIKIESFGGIVQQEAEYAHGAASMYGLIAGMTHNWPFTNEFPLFNAHGMLGSRANAGKDGASPRYVYVSLNKILTDILFPKEDGPFLTYNQGDEGDDLEASMYPPIFPIAICNTFCAPAQGFKSQVYGRDALDILPYVRKLIEGKNTPPVRYFKLADWGVNHRTYRSKSAPETREMSVGRCRVLNGKLIIIDELPVGKSASAYIIGKSKKADKSGKVDDDDEKNMSASGIYPRFKEHLYCRPYDGACTDYHTEIEVEWNEIPFDHKDKKTLYEKMRLTNTLNSSLNLIDSKRRVRTYKSYKEIIDEWFTVRKNLYTRRVVYQIEVNNILIKYYEEIIRFIKYVDKHKVNFSNMKKQAQIDKVRDAGFVPYSKAQIGRIDLICRDISTTEEKTPMYDLIFEMVTDESKTADFSYLLGLTLNSLHIENIGKYEKKIDEFKSNIKYYNSYDRFHGDNIWKNELNKLEKLIKTVRNPELGKEKNCWKELNNLAD